MAFEEIVKVAKERPPSDITWFDFFMFLVALAITAWALL